jgi:hypothetical protein
MVTVSAGNAKASGSVNGSIRIAGPKKQAYTMYARCEDLDAALLLTTRFGFEHDQRLLKTRSAIERELAVGAFVYRSSRAKGGAFVACSCWLVEAYACLGDVPQAKECWRPFLALLETILASSTSRSIRRPEWPWHLPQGLSHLALLHATFSIRRTPGAVGTLEFYSNLQIVFAGTKCRTTVALTLLASSGKSAPNPTAPAGSGSIHQHLSRASRWAGTSEPISCSYHHEGHGRKSQ